MLKAKVLQPLLNTGKEPTTGISGIGLSPDALSIFGEGGI